MTPEEPHPMHLLAAAALLAVLAIVAVTDLVLTSCDQPTISEVLRTWAKLYPIIPFALGCLVGHLFA